MSELRCQEFTKCAVWNLMFDGHLLHGGACVCVCMSLCTFAVSKTGVMKYKQVCRNTVNHAV